MVVRFARVHELAILVAGGLSRAPLMALIDRPTLSIWPPISSARSDELDEKLAPMLTFA